MKYPAEAKALGKAFGSTYIESREMEDFEQWDAILTILRENGFDIKKDPPSDILRHLSGS